MVEFSISNFSTSLILPLEIQYLILGAAEWHQHSVLSQVCTTWRAELSTPRNKSKLYQPIPRSKYATIGWNVNNKHPLIHKALVYQNILKYNDEPKKLVWAHVGTGEDEKQTSTNIPKVIWEVPSDVKIFNNQPAFYCPESGNPIVVGLFTSRYRNESGNFFAPQRLVTGEVMTVGRFLGLMQIWRNGDAKYRSHYQKNPTQWLRCDFFLDSCSNRTSGEKLISVSTEMESDKPDRFTIPQRVFQPRPEIDFDRGCLVERIHRNHIKMNR